jgi:hypothetical protein
MGPERIELSAKERERLKVLHDVFALCSLVIRFRF